MDFGIDGKVAFVAGGSKGMGLAAARMLAAKGAKVGIVAQSWPAINEAVAEIIASGGQAVGVSVDLTDRPSVQRAVADVTDAFGAPPQIVIGQTNDMQKGNFPDVADEDFERCFHTFTMSQIYLVRAVLPAMQERGWGRIIHLASMIAKEPERAFPHLLHNAIRPSTVGFLVSLASEVATNGITINVVAPGFVKTPTLDSMLRDELGIDPATGDEWIKGVGDVPMNRLGRPEEIGALITFLASQWRATSPANGSRWMGDATVS